MSLNKRSILVIGAGGREHALAWKLAQSPQVSQVFVAPGNAGTAVAFSNVPIAADDVAGLVRFAKENHIGLTVVGPEVPLALGIVDEFQKNRLAIFGPSQAAAQLEASKAFSKTFMREHAIPTAEFAIFHHLEEAWEYLEEVSRPWVVKASGLAAGKGVIMCDDNASAIQAVEQIMQGYIFGPAGETVIVEERLIGPEVSLLAFCDGRTAVPLVPARDHKRVFDQDQGPNTGGMGAYAPLPDVSAELVAQIMREVMQPTLEGMAQRGTPYVGVLYAGLMLTPDGLKVLEFNCRFGDPETQVILPMLEGDLVEIMLACIDGRLTADMVQTKPGACATVVMAAGGYPDTYDKGLPIHGLAEAEALNGVWVFQAGTAVANDQIVTNGGRVLAVTGWGETLPEAVGQAYEGVAKIHFERAHYRRDIGRKD